MILKREKTRGVGEGERCLCPTLWPFELWSRRPLRWDISEAPRRGEVTVCFKKSNGYRLRVFQRRTSALRRDHVSFVRGEGVRKTMWRRRGHSRSRRLTFDSKGLIVIFWGGASIWSLFCAPQHVKALATEGTLSTPSHYCLQLDSLPRLIPRDGERK